MRSCSIYARGLHLNFEDSSGNHAFWSLLSIVLREEVFLAGTPKKLQIYASTKMVISPAIQLRMLNLGL